MQTYSIIQYTTKGCHLGHKARAIVMKNSHSTESRLGTKYQATLAHQMAAQLCMMR